MQQKKKNRDCVKNKAKRLLAHTTKDLSQPYTVCDQEKASTTTTENRTALPSSTQQKTSKRVVSWICSVIGVWQTLAEAFKSLLVTIWLFRSICWQCRCQYIMFNVGLMCCIRKTITLKYNNLFVVWCYPLVACLWAYTFLEGFGRHARGLKTLMPFVIFAAYYMVTLHLKSANWGKRCNGDYLLCIYVVTCRM